MQQALRCRGMEKLSQVSQCGTALRAEEPVANPQKAPPKALQVNTGHERGVPFVLQTRYGGSEMTLDLTESRELADRMKPARLAIYGRFPSFE